MNLRALLCNRQGSVRWSCRTGRRWPHPRSDSAGSGRARRRVVLSLKLRRNDKRHAKVLDEIVPFRSRPGGFLRQGGSQRREVGSPRSDSSRQLNLSRDPSDLRCHRWLNRGLNRRLSTRLCVRFLEGQSCIVCVGSPTGRDHHPEACRSTHHPLISLCGPL